MSFCNSRLYQPRTRFYRDIKSFCRQQLCLGRRPFRNAGNEAMVQTKCCFNQTRHTGSRKSMPNICFYTSQGTACVIIGISISQSRHLRRILCRITASEYFQQANLTSRNFCLRQSQICSVYNRFCRNSSRKSH